MAPGTLALLALAALVAWRVYRRARRSIGRQKSRAWRHWSAAILFPLLLLLLAMTAMARPVSQAALASGALAGAALAAWGLKLTRFERDGQAVFYTPNPYIGIALTLLLAGRIVYRFTQLYLATGAAGPRADDITRSPATLLIIALIAGYYATYALGILHWRRRNAPPPPV